MMTDTKRWPIRSTWTYLISNAIGYAKLYSQSHDAVIRVYEAREVIRAHKEAHSREVAWLFPYCRNLTVTSLEQVNVPASHTLYVYLARPVSPVESV